MKIYLDTCIVIYVVERHPRFSTAIEARLRAIHTSLKTPDALHLAAAQWHGCTAFWTNDDRLNPLAPGLAVKVT